MDLHLSLETRGFESGVLVWECYQLKQTGKWEHRGKGCYLSLTKFLLWAGNYIKAKKKRYMTNSLTFKVLQSREIGNNLKS